MLLFSSMSAFAECNEKFLIDQVKSQLLAKSTSNLKIGAKVVPDGTLITYSFDSSADPRFLRSLSGYSKFDTDCKLIEGDAVIVHKAN